MKFNFLGQAYSNQIETLGSEYTDYFWGKSYNFRRPNINFRLAQVIIFSQLIIRVLLNGYRPKIRQGRDRNNNIYWYAYYPLSGVSKVIALETEIQQWLELTS